MKQPIEADDAPERVFVVARDELFAPPAGPVNGFQCDGTKQFLRRAGELGSFRQRDLVEGDPKLKQIIPYGLLQHGERVFVMRRGRGGGETRLHSRVSLGVGGHVNPIDSPSAAGDRDAGDRDAGDRDAGDRDGATRGEQLVDRALRRELDEELRIESPFESRVIGVINDDSNAVGRVHFGIAFRIAVSRPLVRVRETESLEGSFVPIAELGPYRERMESWSRLLLDHLWPALS